ncbi:hypothetical protein JCM16303_005793 [Sporobolomyces ruberrimus]
MEAIKRTTVTSMRFSRRHGSSTSAQSDPLFDQTHGSLHLSTHHLIFERESPGTNKLNGTNGRTSEEAKEGTRPSGENDNELWIPLALLHSVNRTPPTFTGEPTPLILRTRDFYTYSFEFETPQEVDDVFESIKNLCSSFSIGGLENRWAFFCHATPSQQDRKGKKSTKAGWDLYDAKEEFARMGVGKRSKAWRFSDINSDFNFCPSYPAQIVVPARISDTTLNYAVKYRSKCRIPGLVYLHWANFGSITRSSQPMVGITQTSRSIQDEKLIEAIFTSHSQHSGSREAFTISSSATQGDDPNSGGIVYGAMATNVIIDARPTKNAYANSVKGAGTENMTFYKNCKKEYLGIDNIHVMRASLNGVFQALADAETTGSLDRLALRRTNWLSHLTNILEGTLIVIRTIHLSNSHVLVHCSDGWDRTSQLSALPQICLDPFYRTARGLAILIEKDWIAYGHKFTDRSGHLCNDRVEFHQKLGEDATTQQSFLASVQKQFASSSHAFKETCPVFQQFLDCIYQVQRQFPERFEWNEKMLRKLVVETYSGSSGSFLFNSEAERAMYRARERTTSVWEEFFDVVAEEGKEESIRLKAEYQNPLYDPTLDDPESKSSSADQGVLLFDPQDVKYWYQLFGRSDDEMNRKPPVSEQTRPHETERQTVTSPEEDPVLHPLAAQTANLSIRSPPNHASSPLQSRSSSPLPPSRSTNGEQPQQLAETVASVQKFGWSAWKTVQKFGQEAAKQYKDRSASIEDDHSTTNSENGWSTTPTAKNPENENGTNGGGAGSGMWSRFSTISSNPWQQPQETPRHASSTSASNTNDPLSAQPSSSNPISYTPYQPRKPSSSSTPNPPPSHSAPHPVRQPSSALSINPWETISKEDALPTPSILSGSAKKEVAEPPRTGGGDPLGVGGF